MEEQSGGANEEQDGNHQNTELNEEPDAAAAAGDATNEDLSSDVTITQNSVSYIAAYSYSVCYSVLTTTATTSTTIAAAAAAAAVAVVVSKDHRR